MDAVDPILDPVYGMEPKRLRTMHASYADGIAKPDIDVYANADVYANTNSYIHIYADSKRNVYANANSHAYTNRRTRRSCGCVGRVASRSTIRGDDR